MKILTPCRDKQEEELLEVVGVTSFNLDTKFGMNLRIEERELYRIESH